MSGRRGTLVLIGVLLTAAVEGRAEEAAPRRSRVAVVRTPPGDRLLREASTRLRAELAGAGFEVVEVTEAPDDPGAAEPGATGETESFATVAIERAGAGAVADVWIRDAVTGKTVMRRLAAGAQASAASVLAIRALELLRASLLELAAPLPERAPAPAPAREDAVKRVEPAAPSPERAARSPALTLGVLGIHGLSSLGPALGPVGRLSLDLGAGPFARLSVAAPVLATTLGAEGGRASVAQYFSAVELGWSTGTHPVAAFAAAGAGAYYLHTTGVASPPFHSTSDGVVSFLGTAAAGGIARVSRRVAVAAEVAVVGLVPQPVVVIAGTEAGKAGAPSIAASLGLMVDL